MRHGGGIGAVASMALACVFGTVLLLAMASGAGIYRRVEERIGLTYITAKLHAADEAGGIRGGTFGGGDAVFLPEEIDGIPYETILYVYDGALRELFCEQGWEPGPEAGQTVTEARELNVTEAMPGLFRLQYTAGDGHVSTADVWMRSGGIGGGIPRGGEISSSEISGGGIDGGEISGGGIVSGGTAEDGGAA